jgi:cation diffusion facilitator family transporter
MHDALLSELRFEHGSPPNSSANERRTWAVVALTTLTMVAEIAVGWWSGSQALEADGWHMGTHAGAIGIAGLAYWFARTQAGKARFTFGTGKVYALAAWTNALVLLAAAVAVGVESFLRLLRPEPVNYAEALPVAVVGLLVNVASAWLLRPGHAGAHHDHGHPHHHHGHPHDHHGHDHAGHDHDPHGHPHAPAGDDHHHDLNLRSAYLHVLMDLITSVAAIGAIATGYYLGWTRLDPAVGVVGGWLIGAWALSLLRDSGRQLLDMSPSEETMARLRARLEQIDDVRVADLHVWDLGFGRRACMLSLVTDIQRPNEVYRDAVRDVTRVDHLTIEVHGCPDPCQVA